MLIAAREVEEMLLNAFFSFLKSFVLPTKSLRSQVHEKASGRMSSAGIEFLIEKIKYFVDAVKIENIIILKNI